MGTADLSDGYCFPLSNEFLRPLHPSLHDLHSPRQTISLRQAQEEDRVWPHAREHLDLCLGVPSFGHADRYLVGAREILS